MLSERAQKNLLLNSHHYLSVLTAEQNSLSLTYLVKMPFLKTHFSVFEPFFLLLINSFIWLQHWSVQVLSPPCSSLLLLFPCRPSTARITLLHSLPFIFSLCRLFHTARLWPLCALSVITAPHNMSSISSKSPKDGSYVIKREGNREWRENDWGEAMKMSLRSFSRRLYFFTSTCLQAELCKNPPTLHSWQSFTLKSTEGSEHKAKSMQNVNHKDKSEICNQIQQK